MQLNLMLEVIFQWMNIETAVCSLKLDSARYFEQFEKKKYEQKARINILNFLIQILVLNTIDFNQNA